jgi:hypothetical protein
MADILVGANWEREEQSAGMVLGARGSMQARNLHVAAGRGSLTFFLEFVIKSHRAIFVRKVLLPATFVHKIHIILTYRTIHSYILVVRCYVRTTLSSERE